MFERDDADRDDERTRQKYELERRRKWEAKAPSAFAAFKQQLREHVNTFNAELLQRGAAIKNVTINDANVHLATYTYGGALLTCRLDTQTEALACDYSTGASAALAIKLDESDDARVHAGRNMVVANGDLAAALLEPFFLEALKYRR